MAKRTINELIDSDFKFVDAVNYQRLQVALREVRHMIGNCASNLEATVRNSSSPM